MTNSMFKRFVEVGRLVYIAFGPDAGKIGVIVEIIDLNRILVESPSFITRKAVNLKHIYLTKQMVEGVSRGMRRGKVLKAWEAGKVTEKFNATAFAKKRAALAKRAESTDFERFQLRAAKKQRAQKVAPIAEKAIASAADK
uniref:KOW domain-containing protein n=1 Tax=Sexangularia sp. CB-2014 TaxID=1486929 RepID=A0A7S1VK00_9EUKA|eukprot:CAMPEP_0170732858 /NCGR_PEP_ID=MMETSP0437-20130122/1773_1 /TAXON_ID=0 /ORGANISM="Sexangularia sp." /LENGTH=140 /DNA_ID=CAMNT_0011071117 /DNA_START=53 /DNA_END=475 /DNA_ORIENTATION=+